jgi:hypothetical protein
MPQQGWGRVSLKVRQYKQIGIPVKNGTFIAISLLRLAISGLVRLNIEF